MNEPLKGFITYSHEDTEAKHELRKCLAVMELQNELVTWDDGQLTPGDGALQEDILKNVANSDLLLYLVSAASLASKNCNRELAEAIKKDKRVIPIILEHCDWLRHQLSGFEVLPHKGKPLNEWIPESKGWQNVVDGIRKVVHQMCSQTDPASRIPEKELRAKSEFQRGDTFRMLGQLDMAIQAYSNAIELNPTCAEAYNNRGIAYQGKQEYDLAIKNYNEAIKLNPKLAHAYYNRGNIYSQKGDFEHTVKDYTKAIELNPELAHAYYNRAVEWLYLREWEKAKSDLATAKRMGLDIVASFHNAYKGVEKFEKHFGFKLPEDIAHLLTERLRVRYPKTRKFLDAEGNPLESPTVLNLLAQLRNAGMPLGKYVKTKPAFGINTTPTDVFVVDKTVRDELIASHAGSAEILKPFLHGEDIRRWHVDTPHRWLIFAHRGIAINDYPAILQYLEKHRKPLSERKGKQAWYELAASISDTERFAQPKLVCPNTYNHQTFAVDTVGYYYGKTAYLIPTEETWLCGLLNSRTVEWFYSQVSKQLTIDWLRARSGYIQQIPIPDITPVHKALIAKIVDYLIYLQQQPEINSKDLKYARDRIMLRYFERVIDGLVYEAYLPAELHKSDKVFLQPLLDEGLPSIENIQGDKMSAFRDIFELLYDRMHLVRRHLYYLDSIKPIRIIQGKL